jgi:hypothetical protein
MPHHLWTFLQSQPAFNPQATLDDVLRLGSPTSASAHHVFLRDASGDRFVLDGDFAVTGGVPTGGTVTGFEVFMGATKVIHATGYDLSYDSVANAIGAYQLNDGDPTLSQLLETGTTYIGTTGTDYITANQPTASCWVGRETTA